MGANAYIFIEWRRPPNKKWHGTHIALDRRDYEIFDALAAGRSGSGFLYPPRGIPEDVSDVVLRRACLRIIDKAAEASTARWPDATVERKDVSGPPFVDIIRRGATEYAFPRLGLMDRHTWLTLPEIKASLLHRGIDPNQLDTSYSSMLALMEELHPRSVEYMRARKKQIPISLCQP